MRKKTIADKIAEKSFYSKEVQKSWQIHESAFGPILKPAFVDDYLARVDVCAILNFISNRKLKEALNKLDHLKKFVETDADKALYLFMMALIMEFAGMEERMIECYSECNKFKHDFYLPYLKVAKQAQNTCLDAALFNYEETIRCLLKEELNAPNKTILASVYTSYASALIMKHELEKAKEYLDKSMGLASHLPGREATQAIYYAVLNDKDQAIEFLNKIENHQFFVHSKQVVLDILGGKHFQFHEFDMDDSKIQAFWNWFTSNESDLFENLKNKNHEVVIQKMSEQLNQIFDFLEKEIEFGFSIDQDKIQLEFCDNYAVALTKGFEKLIQASPTFVNWTFKIVH